MSENSTSNKVVKKRIGIKKFYDDKQMSQIYSSGTEFAFISAAREQCHPFVYCKDFLHDAIWAEMNKTTATIFGFSYTHGENPPLDFKRTRLAVRDSNVDTEKMQEKLSRSAKFMREIDATLGFKKTRLCKGAACPSNKGEAWIFLSDSRWMHAPPLISFYTTAIRIGMNYKGGDWKKYVEAGNFGAGNDSSYCASGKRFWEAINSTMLEDVFPGEMAAQYPPEIGTNVLHNYAGFVSFSKGSSKNNFTHWKLP